MKKILIISFFVSVFVFTTTFNAMAIDSTSTVDVSTSTVDIPVITPVITPVATKTPVAIEKVKKIFNDQSQCIGTAVDKRETAILANIDTYTTAIKNSFTTRKNDLLVAWNITNKKLRNVAIKNAFAKNKKAKREALKIYKKSRLAIWKEFTKARINCKVEVTGEDMSVDMNFND